MAAQQQVPQAWCSTAEDACGQCWPVAAAAAAAVVSCGSQLRAAANPCTGSISTSSSASPGMEDRCRFIGAKHSTRSAQLHVNCVRVRSARSVSMVGTRKPRNLPLICVLYNIAAPWGTLMQLRHP
jgi:hypothetical protein